MDFVARCRRHFARRGEWWWAPIVYALVVIWILLAVGVLRNYRRLTA